MQIEVKVIKNYDGLRGEYVETIVRKTRKVRGHHVVSYKGRQADVFSLPRQYGEIAGYCIQI